MLYKSLTLYKFCPAPILRSIATVGKLAIFSFNRQSAQFKGDMIALLPLIIFILVPIAEIAMFMLVGDLIGFWPTLATVIITAFIGTTLLRQQGLSVLRQAQETGARGEIPVQSVMDGLFLIIAGAFLLTPGILTDIVGFSFLIPAVRKVIGTYLYKKFSKNITVSTFGFDIHSENSPHGASSFNQKPFADPSPPQDFPEATGPIIDGEIIEEETKPSSSHTKNSDNSPWKK